MSHMEAQVASLQQALLQAKHLMHVKLQDAVAGQKQSDKTVKVNTASFLLLPALVNQKQQATGCSDIRHGYSTEHYQLCTPAVVATWASDKHGCATAAGMCIHTNMSKMFRKTLQSFPISATAFSAQL